MSITRHVHLGWKMVLLLIGAFTSLAQGPVLGAPATSAPAKNAPLRIWSINISPGLVTGKARWPASREFPTFESWIDQISKSGINQIVLSDTMFPPMELVDLASIGYPEAVQYPKEVVEKRCATLDGHAAYAASKGIRMLIAGYEHNCPANFYFAHKEELNPGGRFTEPMSKHAGLSDRRIQEKHVVGNISWNRPLYRKFWTDSYRALLKALPHVAGFRFTYGEWAWAYEEAPHDANVRDYLANAWKVVREARGEAGVLGLRDWYVKTEELADPRCPRVLVQAKDSGSDAASPIAAPWVEDYVKGNVPFIDELDLSNSENTRPILWFDPDYIGERVANLAKAGVAGYHIRAGNPGHFVTDLEYRAIESVAVEGKPFTADDSIAFLRLRFGGAAPHVFRALERNGFLLIGDSAFGPNGYELLSDDYGDLNIVERHVTSRLAERFEFPHDTDQNRVGASPDRTAAFTHRIVREGIGYVSSVPGQQIVPANFRIDHPQGCSVLPKLLENENLVGSRVFTRWTPLLRAYTTTGEYIGPVAAIFFNHGGIYAGSAFAYWGPLKGDNFASDLEKPILLSIVDRLLSRTFIQELLPSSYYNEVGKGVTLGAKVTNRGSAKQQLKAELTIYHKDGRPIHAESKEITLNPRETQEVSFPWSGTDVGYEEFRARLSLNDSGKILDQQETDFAVRTELVIDDEDPGFRADGGWTTASSGAAYDGQHRTTEKESGATARWTPAIRRAGHYDLFARWVSKGDGGPDVTRTKNARWHVHSAKGEESVQLSQRWSSGFWVYLGTFDFSEGSAGWVELASAADGSVSADAIKLVYTDVVPPPSHGLIRVDANGRYFEFEDGTPFLPIGHNFVRFPGSGGEVWGPEAQYNKYFARMQAHGENVLRIFSSLGFGSSGQTKMSVLERHHILFYAARKYGIYLNPALHNFHDKVTVFQLTEDFNRKTCQFLAEEFGGREAPIFSWDLCNDIPGNKKTVPYIKQMKTFLQEFEGPHKHLINIQHGGGTSWDTRTKSSSEEAAILDFTTLRSKSLPVGDNLLLVDPEEMSKVLNERIKNQLPLVKKPIVSGESGPDFVFLNFETPRVAAPIEDLTWEKGTLQGMWVSLTSGATPNLYFMGFFGAKNNPDLSETEYQYYAALSKFASRIQWNKFNSVNCDHEIKASLDAIRVSAIRDENLLIGFLMHDDPQNSFTEVQPHIRISIPS